MNEVALAGLDHCMVCTAAEDKVHLRHYHIAFKRSGSKVSKCRRASSLHRRTCLSIFRGTRCRNDYSSSPVLSLLAVAASNKQQIWRQAQKSDGGVVA